MAYEILQDSVSPGRSKSLSLHVKPASLPPLPKPRTHEHLPEIESDIFPKPVVWHLSAPRLFQKPRGWNSGNLGDLLGSQQPLDALRGVVALLSA